MIEAIETLRGKGPEDFAEHCLAVAELLLLLAGAATDELDARKKLEAAIDDGRALKKFGDWIAGQGGTRRVVDDYSILPRAEVIRDVVAPRDGFITGINAEEVGLIVVDLGGGRTQKGAPIDHCVGVVFQRKVGERVKRGQPLGTIHAGDHRSFEAAEDRLLAAYEFSESKPALPLLIHKVIR